jgi:hypothetical protein
MKAIFTIRLKGSVTGRDIFTSLKTIVENIEYSELQKKLNLSNDEGDFFEIGISSRRPDRDVVIVELPNEEPVICMDKSYKSGDIAVMSYNFHGIKMASMSEPEDTKEITIRVRDEIEKILKSKLKS